ncbi:MAG: MFS transporter [Chloroflexi bacterium]|nr:MFS transporter [Chloroflexota bacterium]MCC6892406.1 MFS transporter [Anaerolineae bacterium]
MSSVISTLRGSFSPLRLLNFRIYLSGQVVSLIGTWLQVTAQAWLVWTLTGSEEASGFVAMLSALPFLLFGPWAGVIAERVDRRKLLIATQVIAMFLAFALAILVQTRTTQLWHVFPPWSQPYNETSWGINISIVQIWHVYVLSFLLGIVNALDVPTQQTFLGDLSGTSELRKAVNLNAMILQVSRMIGPAIAGLVIARIGIAPAFWVNGLSFIAVVASLIALTSTQKRGAHKPVQPFRDLAEALRYLKTQPRIQDLFIFSTLTTLLVLSVILSQLPAVSDKLLHGDAETLGVLQAASGAGALIAVLFIMPIFQNLRRSGIALSVTAIWMGVWLLVFSASRSLPLSMAAIFFCSMGAPTTIATALGMVQFMTPAEMRARVLSLFTMISFGLQTFAVLIVGLMAERLGISTAIQTNGIILILGAALMLIFRTEMRRWEMTTTPTASPAVAAEII